MSQPHPPPTPLPNSSLTDTITSQQTCVIYKGINETRNWFRYLSMLTASTRSKEPTGSLEQSSPSFWQQADDWCSCTNFQNQYLAKSVCYKPGARVHAQASSCRHSSTRLRFQNTLSEHQQLCFSHWCLSAVTSDSRNISSLISVQYSDLPAVNLRL